MWLYSVMVVHKCDNDRATHGSWRQGGEPLKYRKPLYFDLMMVLDEKLITKAIAVLLVGDKIVCTPLVDSDRLTFTSAELAWLKTINWLIDVTK